MQQTWQATILKVIPRKWEGREYYKCRVLTDDSEVLDLSVQTSLVENDPKVKTYNNVHGLLHVTVVGGEKNLPKFVLTGFIPDKK